MRRLWETIRWLRPAQFFGRLRRLVSPARLPALPDFDLRSKSGTWQPPASKRASFSPDGKPTFLNRVGELRGPEDWDRPDIPLLWRYNLHYFDDLLATAAIDRAALHRELIGRWIAENPAPQGTGWEPYPTSLRIVNWVKWALAGNDLQPDWQRSLALQAAWLEKNLEWHLLGNHLFCNAKALVLAGAYFSGEDADRWRAIGLKILRREIPEQVLPDGGQFELSPMYHSLALEDMLDLINVADVYEGLVEKEVIDSWRETAARMLDWLLTMCHPDGRIALLNDSAFGIAPEPADLIDYAGRVDVSSAAEASTLVHLRDSGYVRAKTGAAVLLADVGEIGPDYLPGHAHADTLSFELSLFGQRCIVDAGCSTYEVGEERLRQRGTAAHNTILVDDADSSEVWSSFRVARRARPKDVSVGGERDHISVAASHDGYERLPGKVRHHRKFELSDGRFVVKDQLDGSYTTAVASLLLHPDVDVTDEDGGFLLSTGGRTAMLEFDGGEASVDSANWHPEFGVSLPTKRIRVTLTGATLVTRLTWRNPAQS